MSDKQEALRLADALDSEFTAGRISNYTGRKAAAELRRLHVVNQELLEALDEIAINTHDDTAERVARAAIARAEGKV